MVDLWQATWLSLRIAVFATILALLLGLPTAFAMVRWRFPGKFVVEAIFTLPLVLPPTVVGFLILVAAGSRSPVGPVLKQWFGIDYSIVFTFHGAVLASAIVAFPLIYLPARGAFAQVEREMEDIARLFGANLFQVFWHVSLPMARRAIAGGLLLGFARSLGEFGATVMVFGMFAENQTLPISIYIDFLDGDYSDAIPAVIILTLISLLTMLIYHRTPLARQD